MNCLGKKYIFISVNEQESEKDIADWIVYVCDNEKVAQLKCPCQCGDIIYLNLIPDNNPQRTVPRWIINENSITPSIDKKTGCRSHFTITNGITH